MPALSHACTATALAQHAVDGLPISKGDEFASIDHLLRDPKTGDVLACADSICMLAIRAGEDRIAELSKCDIATKSTPDGQSERFSVADTRTADEKERDETKRREQIAKAEDEYKAKKASRCEINDILKGSLRLDITRHKEKGLVGYETGVLINPVNGAVLAKIDPAERDGTRSIQDAAAHPCGRSNASGSLTVADPDGDTNIAPQEFRFQKVGREAMRVTETGETIATIKGHLPGVLR